MTTIETRRCSIVSRTRRLESSDLLEDWSGCQPRTMTPGQGQLLHRRTSSDTTLTFELRLRQPSPLEPRRRRSVTSEGCLRRLATTANGMTSVAIESWLLSSHSEVPVICRRTGDRGSVPMRTTARMTALESSARSPPASTLIQPTASVATTSRAGSPQACASRPLTPHQGGVWSSRRAVLQDTALAAFVLRRASRWQFHARATQSHQAPAWQRNRPECRGHRGGRPPRASARRPRRATAPPRLRAVRDGASQASSAQLGHHPCYGRRARPHVGHQLGRWPGRPCVDLVAPLFEPAGVLVAQLAAGCTLEPPDHAVGVARDVGQHVADAPLRQEARARRRRRRPGPSRLSLERRPVRPGTPRSTSCGRPGATWAAPPPVTSRVSTTGRRACRP